MKVKPRDISKQLVIDLSHEQGYRRGHIQGAVNLSVEKFDFTRKVDVYGGITRGVLFFKKKRGGYEKMIILKKNKINKQAKPHLMPKQGGGEFLKKKIVAIDEIYEVMKNLGLNNNTSEIILYDNSAMLACRMWFVLRYFGFRNVRVLNGGWRAWLKSGLPVDEKATVLKPGESLDLKPKRSYLLTKPTQMVFDVEHKTSKYIDARLPTAYKGLLLFSNNYHIDGAINIPCTELMEDAIFKSVHDIRRTVETTGVDMEVDRFICYSGRGLSGAVDLFALMMVGADKVSLYDAGVNNWRQNFDSKLSADAEDFLKH
ncbi:rhodanese domain-containing protein [Reticulomyxa filosa]|uniref:Rhodanese domain-containing protein n=1 Tax=Reticulomyxa filosa TaxID=46433 RepID=X6NBW6_RETFI|nr:rhodanese domain-containing protein [Reticulomyxa filosa]|eukprot:ETO23279.1 rhodanese domain-containing protein [Reticulomyxa filosa]